MDKNDIYYHSYPLFYSERMDDMSSNSKIKRTHNIFGSPHQFKDSVDPRITDVSSKVGSNYMKYILAEAPICTIIPGEPCYLPKMKGSGTDKISATKALASSYLQGSDEAKSIFSNFIQNSREDQMRLYDFKRSYTQYMNYVNILCRTGAILLGLGNYEFGGTKLMSYDWSSYRFNTGVNGDGYLFYPGKPYGIDGPVGSIRLEAIRDGLEEYEIFYNLKEKLKSLEIDKEPTFDFLTSYLYEGTKVNATSIEMEDAREDLIQLAMANENGSDFCIVKNDVDKDHNRIDYTFYANNGTSIKINGETLSEGEAYKNGHLFNISVNLNNDTNILNIEVIYNGKTNVIEHNVGPKNDVYDANDLNNTFEKYNASIATSITSYDEYQNVLKMEIGKTTEKKQSIKFVPTFLKDIGEKTANMTFNIINPTSEDIEFSVGYRSSANTFDSYFEENLILKPGYNTITINLAITKWKSIGSLKYIMLVFGNSTSKAEEAKTVYLNNFIISKKQGGK